MKRWVAILITAASIAVPADAAADNTIPGMDSRKHVDLERLTKPLPRIDWKPSPLLRAETETTGGDDIESTTRFVKPPKSKRHRGAAVLTAARDRHT